MTAGYSGCTVRFRSSRRTLLSRAACGFGSVAAAHLLAGEKQKTDFTPKALSVIFLYMDGGVSQVDSFDPKPELDRRNGQPFPAKIEPTQFNNIGNTLASPWKFQNYGQSGIPVSDLFPEMARHVDDMAIVRSMTSAFPEHTNANYFLHTGSGLQGRPSRDSEPAAASR